MSIKKQQLLVTVSVHCFTRGINSGVKDLFLFSEEDAHFLISVCTVAVHFFRRNLFVYYAGLSVFLVMNLCFYTLVLDTTKTSLWLCSSLSKSVWICNLTACIGN